MLFLRVCWEQGVQKAVMLTTGFLSQRFGVSRSILPIKPKFPPRERSNAGAWLHLLKLRPLVSIIMPVYNSRWLNEAVESVLKQSYDNFELILVDDCSTLPETLQALDAAGGADRRIKLVRNAENKGISGATNAGIEASGGDYIAFMDHDDLIHPDALALFARTLNDGHDEDFFFSDEVIIDGDGGMDGYMQKCPLSMDLLLSCNAASHFCLIKRTALDRIGPLKPEYDGAQDHDIAIRAMELGLRFFHMPYFLYAWRAHSAATSGSVRSFDKGKRTEYPKAYLNGKKAIQDHLDRMGIKAAVTDDAFFWYRVKYELPPDPDEVAVIIPFKDHVKSLRRLLETMEKGAYRKLVIYLVNNRSTEPETTEYLQALRREGGAKYRFVDFDEPFNYSRLYNEAVAEVPNEILLFMNNDMEVVNPDWMEAMLEHIYREKVGAVGCRLVRRNGTIQHAGMIFKPNIYYCAANLFFEDGYYTKVQREVSGVTAACMMIRKSVFEQVGGFDEVHFPIGFSDADLCLKIRQAGYKIIYTPFAELLHEESKSRNTHEEYYEKFTLYNRYIGDTLLNDTNYKPS